MSFIVTFLDFSVPSIVNGCPSELVNRLLSPLFAEANMSVGSCLSPYDNPYFQTYLCWKRLSVGASFGFQTNVTQSPGERLEVIGYSLSKQLGFPQTSTAIDADAGLFKVYAMIHDSLGVPVDVDLSTLLAADFAMDLPALQFKSLVSPTQAQRVHISVRNLTFSTLAVSGIREDRIPASLASTSVFTSFPAPVQKRYTLFNGTKSVYDTLELRIPDVLGGACGGSRLLHAGAEIISVDPASVEARAADYDAHDYSQDIQLETTVASAEYAEMYVGPLFWPDIHSAVDAFSVASLHAAGFQQAYIHGGPPTREGDRYVSGGITFTPVASNVNIPKNATVGYIVSSENYICDSQIASEIDKKIRLSTKTFVRFVVGNVRCWPNMPTPPAPPPAPPPRAPSPAPAAASDTFPVWAILLIVLLPLCVAVFFARRAFDDNQEAKSDRTPLRETPHSSLRMRLP